MNCPRCDRELQEINAAGTRVDVCQNGCGGIWFDANELERMDQPDEPAGWILEHMRIDISEELDLTKPLPCPRCPGHTLMRQRYKNGDSIMIDRCRSCGGTWLDFGELYSIRSANPSTSEARALTRALLLGLRTPGTR